MREMGDDKPKWWNFKRNLIGYFYTEIVALRTIEGNLSLFIAIDSTS